MTFSNQKSSFFNEEIKICEELGNFGFKLLIVLQNTWNGNI